MSDLKKLFSSVDEPTVTDKLKEAKTNTRLESNAFAKEHQVDVIAMCNTATIVVNDKS